MLADAVALGDAIVDQQESATHIAGIDLCVLISVAAESAGVAAAGGILPEGAVIVKKFLDTGANVSGIKNLIAIAIAKARGER